MKTKPFDCVEMKRKAALEIYERLKGLSKQEKLAYWQKRHEENLREREERKKSFSIIP